MIRISRILTCLLAFLATLPVFARDFEFTYKGQTLTYAVISEAMGTCKPKDGYWYFDDRGVPGNKVSGSLVIPASVNDGNKDFQVTSIGGYAFSDCSGLTSVTIPNSVTSIGDWAFSNCSGLTSVTIPNSVTSIGRGTFYKCSSLKSVTIPNSVTSIGGSAFDDCSGLTSVTIPNSVTSIGGCAFQRCSSLKSVTIPESVTSIGGYAFAGCSGLTSVTIPNSVTSIGGYAFSKCSGLTSVTIPESVISIGGEAFYGCTGLIKSAYPNRLENPFPSGIAVSYNPNGAIIEDGWIYGPEKSEIRFAPYYLEGDYQIPETVISISDYAFRGCNGLLSITIPNSVINIGEEAFQGCDQLVSLYIGSGVLEIGKNQCQPAKVIWQCNTPPKGYGYLAGKINYVANNSYRLQNMVIYPLLSSVFESAGVKFVPVNPAQRTCDIIDCSYSDATKNLILNGETIYKGIQMSVINVNPYSFYDNDFIENLSISFTGAIPEYTFYDCDNISEINILNTVSTIGEFAFYSCDIAKIINLYNSGSIGESAFEGSAKLAPAKLSIGETVTDISSKAFYNCGGLTEITLNNSGSLGDYAFNGCSALQTAQINNDGSLGDYAFLNCSNLKEINLQNVGAVGINCFENCSSAESLTIAPTVTSIGDNAFEGCRSIGDVTIEMITSVDADDNKSSKQVANSTLILGSNGSSPIFNDCPLDEVYIGRKLSYRTASANGYSPFYRNTNLRSVEITDAETQIYDYEFYGCSNLQDVKIGDGVKSFGKYAFSGCSKIESFEFGRSVASIGEEAFSDCTAMTSLTSHNPEPPVCGTEALDDINKWECTLHIPNETLNSYMAAPQWNNFFFISDDVSSEKIFEYQGLYYRATDLDNYLCEVISPNSVPASIKADEAYYVSDEKALNLAIPETVINNGVMYTVKGIGSDAFENFKSLEKVTIPSAIEYIGANAFSECNELTEVIVDAVVPPTLEESSFSRLTYLSAVLRVPEESISLYQNHTIWSKFKGFFTGVSMISGDDIEELSRYNLEGYPVNQDYKGVVIIHYSNGSIKKLFNR